MNFEHIAKAINAAPCLNHRPNNAKRLEKLRKEGKE